MYCHILIALLALSAPAHASPFYQTISRPHHNLERPGIHLRTDTSVNVSGTDRVASSCVTTDDPTNITVSPDPSSLSQFVAAAQVNVFDKLTSSQAHKPSRTRQILSEQTPAKARDEARGDFFVFFGEERARASGHVKTLAVAIEVDIFVIRLDQLDLFYGVVAGAHNPVPRGVTELVNAHEVSCDGAADLGLREFAGFFIGTAFV
ncbi:hypothetical protein C8J57DRAFT_1232474 [Mycena rebaudengoi]|nr:hypothetical protein C8J57DRAFT_1232474 [Mycena rebaudengoi]